MMKSGRDALIAMLLAVLVAGCSGSAKAVKVKEARNAAQINSELGLGYMQQGNLELALQKLERAVELDPQLASGQHYLAALYQQLGQNEGAEKHYRQAMFLTPEDPVLLNNYGVFLCRQNKLTEAERLFETAVKQPFYKTPEVAYKNAGLCALHTQDTAKAEAYFRKALKVNPRMGSALLELAALSHQESEYLSARAFMQRYFEVAPATARSLWLGVQVEQRLGDSAAAAKYAARLREQFPQAEETVQMMKSDRR